MALLFLYDYWLVLFWLPTGNFQGNNLYHNLSAQQSYVAAGFQYQKKSCRKPSIGHILLFLDHHSFCNRYYLDYGIGKAWISRLYIKLFECVHGWCFLCLVLMLSLLLNIRNFWYALQLDVLRCIPFLSHNHKE